jgi:hypothetical protein
MDQASAGLTPLLVCPMLKLIDSALYDAAHFREGWYHTLGDNDLA